MVKNTGAFDNARHHMMETHNKLVENTNSIVSSTAGTQHADADTVNQPVDHTPLSSLAEKMMQNQLFVYQIEASSVVIKTADEMLGTLLDVSS